MDVTDRTAKAIERRGRAELAGVRRQSRLLFASVGLFSVFVNLLMLTGPLYMLQVYDRVLGSRSVETLLALTLVMGFLYAMMGLLDFARGRVLARAGARFQSTLDKRVFQAMLKRAGHNGGARGSTTAALADLEGVQRFLSSPVLPALFDLPWTPLFLAGIFLFHSWLGLLAVGGGLVLVAVTLLNQATSRDPLIRAAEAQRRAQSQIDEIAGESEVIQGLGMRGAAFSRWSLARAEALSGQIASSDLSGSFSTLTRTLRMFLQSAMLGLGAYLVLRGELTPGAMIASSILMGRALAPIDVTIGQWSVVQRALRGWQKLSELLGQVPPEAPRTALPRPRGTLTVQELSVAPPGDRQFVLRGVSFQLPAGQALGVIGASGAGKSSLARAITGVWPVTSGRVRLDGATLDQYDPDVLGGLIGYLPQRVQLFDGTIAQNIARLADKPDSAGVVAAAKAAAAHEMILQLPDGYDTRVASAGGRLSGGQMQRIGLARALYGDPVLLVLDEPNSNLDNQGSQALNTAIRGVKARGGSVMIMAHRPAAIQECDLLLMLENGQRRAFGPRDDVLREVTKNHEQIQSAKSSGGVT